MKIALLISQLIVATPIPGQIDSVCRGYCSALTVQGGIVRFVDQEPGTRKWTIGHYLGADQRLVPAMEAPVRHLRSKRGWRIVASAFLNHDECTAQLRLHFLAPDGMQRTTEDVSSVLEQVQIGNLFGGSDEIFAITTNELHVYNNETEIWFLPERGEPKRLLRILGVYATLTRIAAGKIPGVTVARQTYDGVHSDTKGTVQEFYTWDAETKSLILGVK